MSGVDRIRGVLTLCLVVTGDIVAADRRLRAASREDVAEHLATVALDAARRASGA